MSWVLWGFGNIALVASFSGLLALIFLRYKLRVIPLMTEALMVGCFFLGAFGYGFDKYSEGREAGVKSEALKWEIEMDNLRAAKRVEKIKATEANKKSAENALKKEREIVELQLKERGLEQRLAELSAQGNGPIVEPRAVTTIPITKPTEGESNACPKSKPILCSNFYGAPADDVILRELKKRRGQE